MIEKANNIMSTIYMCIIIIGVKDIINYCIDGLLNRMIPIEFG